MFTGNVGVAVGSSDEKRDGMLRIFKYRTRKWLVGKMPIPDAFRATQAEMRERFLNPYLWAGFVLVA